MSCSSLLFPYSAYPHKMCSQVLTEGHPLSSVTADSASAASYSQQDGFSEQGENVDRGKDQHEYSITTQSDNPHSNHGNQVPLVFSHLEPTRGETVSTSCGECVHVLCRVDLCQHQTCQNCGQKHILTEDSSCLASSSLPEPGSEAETLLDSLQSLSMSSSTGVASGNQDFDHPAERRAMVTAPEHSCGASNSVSSSSTHWVWPDRYSGGHSSRALCHSCRAEVMRVDYLDDVTVDDLAGYFDQLLYLPRPMSEMAELMYT